MKTVFLQFVIIILFFRISAQENPFMEMANKKYAEYTQDLVDQYYTFYKIDTLAARKIINQIAEVAQKTGSTEWKLLTAYFESMMYNKMLTIGDERYTSESYLEILTILLEKAKKASVPYLELMIRQEIIDYYWTAQNYEFAFELYAVQLERLEYISSEDVPEKVHYYQKAADAYCFFKNYPKAISYYCMVLEEKDNIRSQHSKQHARNGLGLCYRLGYNALDRSDSCFLALMHIVFQPENGYLTEMWDAIAEGSIGHNMYLRKDYDKAIPLLKNSINKMLKYGDYGFSTGPAVNLADIYLKTGDIAESKRYIDLATDYYHKEPRDGHLFRIYEVKSKYFATIGNKKLSMAYMDSTLEAKEKYNDRFNTMLLLHIEQKELTKQQQQLIREKEKHKQTQMQLLFLAMGFVVIVGLLGLVLFFYRRKRTAYRELVRKSQQWAKNEKEVVLDNSLKNVDQQLFDQLQQFFQHEFLYRDSTMNVEKIAQRMKINRTYLSRAINRCTGSNFSSFINEYRIKEAILLMSDNPKKYSLEGLGYEVGFNDRKTFYTAFKKQTGLSPSDFRGNLKKK
jgi:AraC-like DNA-binding protein